jgi:hypothetical protein
MSDRRRTTALGNLERLLEGVVTLPGRRSTRPRRTLNGFVDPGGQMRQAFMAIDRRFTTYPEDMTLVAPNAEPRDPRPRRRR